MTAELVRGVRDFSPGEAIALKEITSVIEEVFKRFGFYPIETPSIESTETLDAKAYGQESRNEIYLLEGEKAGLIYDLTVPLARYISMNKDVVLPFKRYQITRVWRRDEPQKMRSREFMQADIDIVGSKDPLCEAEIIGANALALEALGIHDYTILINSRVFLNAILNLFKIPEDKQTAAIIAIDKLAKTGRKEVAEQLERIGVDARTSESLLNMMKEELENGEKLEKLVTKSDGVKAEVENMNAILGMLARYNLRGKIAVDFSLARGLNYYTGTIWEFVVREHSKQLPTLASGGRYDKLIGIYSKSGLPAVGTSIGIYRIYEMLKSTEGALTSARAFVAYIGKENAEYAISMANTLRSNGIYTDLNAKERSLSKQLEYANSLKIRYTIIVGSLERQANKAKIRDMVNGNEEMLNINELIQKLKG